MYICIIIFCVIGSNEDIVLHFALTTHYLRQLSNERVEFVLSFNHLTLDIKLHDYILKLRKRHDSGAEDELIFS